MIDFWPRPYFYKRFPPKISSLQATPKKSTEHTDNTEKDFCLLFYLKLATLIYPRVNCPYVIFEVLSIFVP